MPLDPAYAASLGTVAFCFASCEWNVAWCCERLRPGSHNKFRIGKATAGQIGKTFRNLIRNMPPSSERDALDRLAVEFLELVELRNDIMHGKPCDAPTGTHRLSGSQIWHIPDLNAAADRFTECSIEVNDMLHGFLATYSPQPTALPET